MVHRMQECGMEQSDLDPCLFLSNKVIAITYVDDILFWARNEEARLHNPPEFRADPGTPRKFW